MLDRPGAPERPAVPGGVPRRDMARRDPAAPFPVARFLLHGTVERRIDFPDFSGSALRGAFGHALRRAACVTGQSDCRPCPLYRRCAYPALFEPPPPPAARRAYANVPPPYVLEPPAPGPLALASGAEFGFGLVLVGPAIRQLALIVGAFRHALTDIGRGSVRLRRVEAEGGERVMDLATSGPLRLLHLDLVVPPVPADLCEVRLDFGTPFALARNGKDLPVCDMTARDLLMSLVRRTAEMSELHLNQELDADFSGLAQLASTVQITPDFQPFRFARHSSRQQRSMPMLGSLGRVTLRGELAPFWPFLHLGQWLHVGKKCVFGFGRYTLHAAAS